MCPKNLKIKYNKSYRTVCKEVAKITHKKLYKMFKIRLDKIIKYKHK